jgi:predicted membrane GTPase involved in stress response
MADHRVHTSAFFACSILGMVDGAVLLVDAVEGPLAQTKFVLAKALSRGLAPIVVLNKVDRPAATQARCDAVASQLFDLFASLGADDRQLDFPILYSSSKQVGSHLHYAMIIVVNAVSSIIHALPSPLRCLA